MVEVRDVGHPASCRNARGAVCIGDAWIAGISAMHDGGGGDSDGTDPQQAMEVAEHLAGHPAAAIPDLPPLFGGGFLGGRVMVNGPHPLGHSVTLLVP